MTRYAVTFHVLPSCANVSSVERMIRTGPAAVVESATSRKLVAT